MGKNFIKNIRRTTSFIKDNQQWVKENKKQIDNTVMDTQSKIQMASAILEAEAPFKAKRIKKDKGLLERSESSTIILTEDNKELLKD